MDYYHSVDVFTRRISYKPKSWMENFQNKKNYFDFLQNENVKKQPKLIYKSKKVLKPITMNLVNINNQSESIESSEEENNLSETKNLVTVKVYETSSVNLPKKIFISKQNICEVNIDKIENFHEPPTSVFITEDEKIENSEIITPQSCKTKESITSDLRSNIEYEMDNSLLGSRNKSLSTVMSDDVSHDDIYFHSYKKEFPKMGTNAINKMCINDFPQHYYKKQSRENNVLQKCAFFNNYEKHMNLPNNVDINDASENDIIKNLVTERFARNKRSYRRNKFNNKLINKCEIKCPETITSNSEQCTITEKIEPVNGIIYIENKEEQVANFDNINDKSKIANVINNSLINQENENCSYDSKIFLQEALGDEFNNLTDSLGLNSTSMLNDITIPDQNKSLNNSIDTTQASDLLSNSNVNSSVHRYSKFCHTLRNKLSKSFRSKTSYNGKMISDKPKSSLIGMFDDSPKDRKILYLIQQSAIQRQRKIQIAKALTLCKTKKKFNDSIEQIEGERLLLVTCLTEECILNEIQQIEYEQNSSIDPDKQIGSLTLSNICLKMLFDISNFDIHRNECLQWYVCTVSNGIEVKSTEATVPKIDGTISFSTPITMINLKENFVLKIGIYYMLQKKSLRNYSHESKYNLCETTKCLKCYLPHKLLQKEHKSDVENKNYKFMENRTSTFIKLGDLELRLHNLTLNKPHKLQFISSYVFLEDIINFDIRTSLSLSLKHSGFLTIGTEAGGFAAWNRYWCVLDGHLLKYWNYPQDEDSHNPLDEINLKNCITKNITFADREVCAKPKTILLETIESTIEGNQNSIVISSSSLFVILRHLLSGDSNEDIIKWAEMLNYVVASLRNWNVTNNVDFNISSV